YVGLGRGPAGRLHIAAALASVVLLAVMVRALAGRLTLDYSQHLAETIAVAERTATGRHRAVTPRLFFSTGEARAVALLVRSQFQTDLKFRLAVLSMLPLTVFYAWFGGTIQDPFVQPQGSPNPLLLVTIMMFPATLRTQLIGSDAFHASWIFFATPADRIRLVHSAKKVVVPFFLLPYR